MSKSRKLVQEKPSVFYILPIAFVIAVVPLIVFMKLDNLSTVEITNWKGESTYTDFFSYYKGQWLMIGTILAIIFFMIHGFIKKFEIKQSFIYIPALAYAGLIILSTVFSKNIDIAVSGFVARYEGMISLLCYLALMLITFNLVKGESQIRFLFGALLVSSIIVGLLGLFQYLGFDLFRTAFGKYLILPELFHKIAGGIDFRFDSSAVYSTFSNPNYIGSYMVLLIPIAFMSVLASKKLYFKIGSGLLTLILIIVLVGSKSDAGLVGLAAIVLLAIFIVFKKKIWALIGVLGLIVVFFGANYVAHGALMNRILSGIGFTSESQYYDLQDITFGDNSVSIMGPTETLVIKKQESHLYFYDEKNNELEYDLVEDKDKNVITFKDAPYRYYKIDLYSGLLAVYQKGIQFQFTIEDDGFNLIGINGKQVDNIEKPETFGFKGLERLGSARGYIWSRTIPMLRKTVFIGYGPDNYIIEFPQGDYIGKIRAYGLPQMIVDKPHNIYLQIAVNTGVLSLIAVLVLFSFYVIQSIGVYLKKRENNYLRLTGMSIFLAVCGYLVTSFFNDSVVGIAPIFWVLLGLGFVCNLLNKDQQATMRPVK